MNNVTQLNARIERADSDKAIAAFLGAPQVKPWWKRPTALVGLAVVGAMLLLLTRYFAGDIEQAYATEDVRLGALVVSVSATGKLQPTRQVDVGSEQSGLVTEVYAQNNDRVVKGQPLARMDTSRLRDAIVQNQAALAAQQAQVGQANATLHQARSSLARLEEVFRLSNGKVPSRTELDNARAEQQRALAALRGAEAQVVQAKAVASSGRTNLSKATIYSPVTGVVLSRHIDPGQTVAASFSAPVLFTIAEDLSNMRLEVKVDEADVGEVVAGQRATFAVDAFPGRSFPARIMRVDVGANASDVATSNSSSSVVSYMAILSVANQDLILRPGMTATASIVTAERRRDLLIPNAAFRYAPPPAKLTNQGLAILPKGPPGSNEDVVKNTAIGRGSRQTIYILDGGGKPQPIMVVTGFSNGSHTAVLAGKLRPGMRVITGQLAQPE